MNRYVPLSEEDRAAMRKAVGVDSIEELFADCPKVARIDRDELASALPGATEEEVLAAALAAARKTPRGPALAGGSEAVEVPSVVEWAANLGPLLTAYTPYQPEASQGTLAYLFEFQTMISELFGLPVANAGVFDGGSALAEAVRMALAETGRRRVLLSNGVPRRVRRVVATYLSGLDEVELEEVPLGEAGKPDERTAAVVLAEPNRLGLIEPSLPEAFAAAREAGAVPIQYAHPIALGALRTPGENGAEVAAAEGRHLGTPPSAGGPYLGLLAATERFLRRMPGRIVGETTDAEGRRAFCLTLQTREQHIRRARATSNICTNQTNNALRAVAFLAALGPKGLAHLAERAFAMTEAAVRIAREAGLTVVHPRPGETALGAIVVRGADASLGEPCEGIPGARTRVVSLWGVRDEGELEAAFARAAAGAAA